MDYNTKLRDMLARRDMSVEKLADMIFSVRTAVLQVLRGSRTGAPTWRKLKRVMSAEEFECARQFANEQRKKAGLPVLKPCLKEEAETPQSST
jgi:hypothetical protein